MWEDLTPAGLRLGFWYSITDTDSLESFNRDYHDKGVYFSIPVRILTDYETNKKYSYGISPWSRDVAVKVYHWQNLYDMGKDLMPGEVHREYGPYNPLNTFKIFSKSLWIFLL